MEPAEDQRVHRLCTRLRHDYEKPAARDPQKVGEKARVLMLLCDALLEYAVTNKASELLWGTYEHPSRDVAPLIQQVAELTALYKRETMNDEEWSLKMEQNLVGRAGLLIDLELINPSLFRQT